MPYLSETQAAVLGNRVGAGKAYRLPLFTALFISTPTAQQVYIFRSFKLATSRSVYEFCYIVDNGG